MQAYGDLINNQVPLLAAGILGCLVGSDPLQGILVTSHGAFRFLRKWEIRKKLSTGNVQVPACIALTVIIRSIQTYLGSVGVTDK
jgi:hypothetical protein